MKAVLGDAIRGHIVEKPYSSPFSLANIDLQNKDFPYKTVELITCWHKFCLKVQHS